jgi:hypothetical protein
MDMKRILQAMDGVATKSVEGVNDMAKFLSVVNKNSSVQILQEASPHKVTLPVQMAMQHYQEPVVKKEQKQLAEKVSSLRSYFKLVESEQFNKVLVKDPAVVNRARIIAERIRLKEYSTDQLTRASVHNGPGLERLEDLESEPKKKDNITTPTATRTDKSVGAAYGGAIGGTIDTLGKGLAKALGGNAIGGAGDIISSTWDAIHDRIKLALDGNASEEEITQLQQEVVRLHKEAEESKEHITHNETELAKKEEELAKLRDTYEQLEKAKQQAIILPTHSGGQPRPQQAGPNPFDRPLVSLRYESKIKEANAKKRSLKKSNPCWKGYHPVGTKKKGGRTVPNCVPKK